MQHKVLRRSVATTAVGAVTAATLLAGTGVSAADTTRTNFMQACKASALISQDLLEPNGMIVDAPAEVQPGEQFTYRIQQIASSFPNSQSGASTTNISRLKLDLMIPENATFVSAVALPTAAKGSAAPQPGYGINLDNVAPNVLRVNDSGNVDSNGQILRLSGNNEVIGNSPKSNLKLEGGIRAPKWKLNLNGAGTGGDSWYQLPAVDVTVVAGQSGVIQPKLRTGGDAGVWDSDKGFYTFLPLASLFGKQWAPTRCVPALGKGQNAGGPGAGPLATINIAAVQQDVTTATTLTGDTAVETGATSTYTAVVTPADATGTLQLTADGTPVGTPVAVTAGQTSYTLPNTFAAEGTYEVQAVFTADTGYTSSTSTPLQVTATTAVVPDVTTATTLTGDTAVETGTTSTYTAVVTPADATGTLHLTVDGANTGAPVAVTAGQSQYALAHAFAAEGTYEVQAVFTADTGYTSSTSTPLQVTATNAVVPDVTTATTLTGDTAVETGTTSTYTAVVTPADATGTLHLTADGTPVGTPVAVTAGQSQYTLPNTFNAEGTYEVQAVFTADAGYTSSTSTPLQVTATNAVVPDVQTAITVTEPDSAEVGVGVNLSAKISPVPAGGTVQFKDGGADIGSPVAVDSSGSATLSLHDFTTAGLHVITAVYSGTPGFEPSTSAVRTVTVTEPVVAEVETDTVVIVSSSASAGQPVTLKAIVAPANANGTVQFKVSGVDVGQPVPVDQNGVATLVYTFATAGSFEVTAEFAGADGFRDSSAAVSTVNVTGGAGDDGATGSLGSAGGLRPIFGSLGG